MNKIANLEISFFLPSKNKQARVNSVHVYLKKKFTYYSFPSPFCELSRIVVVVYTWQNGRWKKKSIFKSIHFSILTLLSNAFALLVKGAKWLELYLLAVIFLWKMNIFRAVNNTNK